MGLMHDILEDGKCEGEGYGVRRCENIDCTIHTAGEYMMTSIVPWIVILNSGRRICSQVDQSLGVSKREPGVQQRFTSCLTPHPAVFYE
jgi:hypothetical protein